MFTTDSLNAGGTFSAFSIVSDLSFSKRFQAQLISASPHSDLPIIYQRNDDELEPCFRAVRWTAKNRREKSKPGR